MVSEQIDAEYVGSSVLTFHCNTASRSYECMLKRTMERKTFGKYLWQHGGCQEKIADSLSDLEAARLLTLNCAAKMDQAGGPRQARSQISSIKVAVPILCHQVVDRAMQIHGGAGLSQDFFLAKALAGMRSLQVADGPNAVHQRTVALLEIRQAKERFKSKQGQSRL